MKKRDAETMTTIREFQGRTQECAAQMLLNALYIHKELANVRMSDELRQRTVELCSTLIGTKHDLVTEILELDERLEAGAGDVEVLRRVDRMVQWAGEDAQKMHEVVMALAAEAQQDVMNVGAHLLVSESAVNILTPLKQMQRRAAQLKEVLS